MLAGVESAPVIDAQLTEPTDRYFEAAKDASPMGRNGASRRRALVHLPGRRAICYDSFVREQLYGKYALIDRIAVGGMAEIFLARQQGLEGFEKTIVIKRIRPHLGDKKSFVKMFLNEAKLAAQLTHPHIVQIFDLGKIGESFFIAMEYVFGRDMRRIVPKASTVHLEFPLVYALKVASSVCEGLSYAHTKTDNEGQPLGIVHRDITPENVMVSFDGAVKVLDFGIAKAAGQVEQTRAGDIKGKLAYMSPEQCTGRSLDHRSDLFSLGVVLYEWATGFKLFTGESDIAVLKAITEGKIYKPSYFRAEIPVQVEAILMRALERDPAARYQTAWEMQADIDRFLSANEFTPSNVHLANFVRQLFPDEMEEEKRRLSAQGTTVTGEFAAAAAMLAGRELSQPGRAVSPLAVREETAPGRNGGPRKDVVLSLADADYEALKNLAAKNALPMDALVKEIVGNYLKYR